MTCNRLYWFLFLVLLIFPEEQHQMTPGCHSHVLPVSVRENTGDKRKDRSIALEG